MADKRASEKEILELGLPELQVRLKESREELLRLRLANTVEQRLKNPMRIRHTRRVIARILTLVDQKRRTNAKS